MTLNRLLTYYQKICAKKADVKFSDETITELSEPPTLKGSDSSEDSSQQAGGSDNSGSDAEQKSEEKK